MQMRIVALVLAGTLALPALGAAEDAPGILESAETAMAELVAAQGQNNEPERRRSMARTWGGVGLMVGGLALIRQKCDGIRFDDRCLGSATWMGGSTVAGLGVIGVGVLLVSIWSDVPANTVSLDIAPGRVQVGKTFAF